MAINFVLWFLLLLGLGEIVGVAEVFRKITLLLDKYVVVGMVVVAIIVAWFLRTFLRTATFAQLAEEEIVNMLLNAGSIQVFDPSAIYRHAHYTH